MDNLEKQFGNIMAGMTAHNAEVRQSIGRLNDKLSTVLDRHYQAHHTPYTVLDFPGEVEYQEQLLAYTINDYLNPAEDSAVGVDLLRYCSYVIIRGELQDGQTIRFDERKFSHMFINGEEYTGDYTAHLDQSGAREKVTVFVVQTPYNLALREMGELRVDIDDFPLLNTEIYCNVSTVTNVQPEITSLLEDDGCISLYVNGDWIWQTDNYCPIRTLSVTGVLTFVKTYRCPNLQNLYIPNTTNVMTNSATARSYRNIDISNVSGDICANAFDSAHITGHLIINNRGKVENAAFQYCHYLTSVEVCKATGIYANAFGHCNNLRTATIGNTVTLVGNYTFGNCPNLQRIEFGNALTSCDYNAFTYSPAIREIYVAPGYHCPITYFFYNTILDWHCFLDVCRNCAAQGENGRTAEQLQFKVASVVRTELTNAYNNNDEDAIEIYRLMTEKNISITT